MTRVRVRQVTRWAVEVDGEQLLADTWAAAVEAALEAAEPPRPLHKHVGPRDTSEWVTPRVAGAALGVSADWMIAMAVKHHIDHVTTRGGHRRYDPEGVARAAGERAASGRKATV